MKMRLKWYVVPALALGLGACKKEAPPAKTEPPSVEMIPAKPDVTPVPTPESTKPEVSAVTDAQRAAKLGFAKHLPKGTESLITIYDAAKMSERAKTLKLWKFIEEQTGMSAEAGEMPEQDPIEEAAKVEDPAEGPAETTQPTDPVEETPAEEVTEAAPGTDEAPAGATEEEIAEGPAGEASENASPWKDSLGLEVTMAIGDTGSEQIGHLLSLYRRFNYFQVRASVKSLIAQAKKTDEGMSEMEDPMSEQMFYDVVNDPEGGIGLFEKMTLPPIYIAMKTDAAKREQVAQEISSSLGFVGTAGEQYVVPVEIEKAGGKFTGYKILGAKMAEEFASSRGDMEKNIDPEVLDRMFASLAKKDIVVMSGTVGDYVVLFLGSSETQFNLVTDEKESLAAGNSLGFADPYIAKDLAAVVYGDKESLEIMTDSAGGISDMAKALRDGVSGEDGLGDTREIESLLQVVVEREEILRKLSRTDSSGTVAYFEEGLKIESVGGTDQGAIDWKTPTKLGALGAGPDVLMFANFVGEATYDKAGKEFMESVFQTAYAITKKISDLPGTDENLVKFKDMSKIFDDKFRVDAIAIWDALSNDFSDGLGLESAMVMDLKGTVPAIPGLPQEVIDQGHFPRISFVTPVVDRAKLASSWDKMNTSGTSVMAKVSEIVGKEIPMQKPMSSESNGLKTWFFPMPFFNDDFLPSVTVSDKWFVASTSKNQAVDLAAKAAAGVDGEKGLVVKLNFTLLQKYSMEVLELLDKNATEIFGEGSSKLEEFQDNKENIRKTIEAMDDFDSMSGRSYLDGSTMRSSIHFKTR